MPQLLKRLLFIAALLTAAILIGTFGFAIVEGWSLFDSFYMTLMTLTTVGYGEVHPLGQPGRLFASFLMLVGVTTVFVSIASDAENVYVALSAKVLNPNLVIAARASDEQAEEKLRRAGATTVFTPYSFIGHRLAQSLLRPHVASFLDVASAFRQSSDLDLEIEQVQVNSSSSLVTKTIEQLRLGSQFGVIVLAVRHKNGVMQFNPPADLLIETDDVLIAMGERTKLKRLEQETGQLL